MHVIFDLIIVNYQEGIRTTLMSLLSQLQQNQL